MLHIIIATVLAVLVIAGYYPSPDGPKYDPIERQDVPVTASAETRVAIDKANAEIDKTNAERQQSVLKEQRAWEKHGRERHTAFVALMRFGAALLAALWVVYAVCAYLVKPLLKFLKDFLGEEFAKVGTPMVLLGIAYVLALILRQNSGNGQGLPTHGLVLTVITYIQHVIRPFVGFIIDFTEFVVKNWTVAMVYLLIVVYAILRKFVRPVQ